MSRKKHPYVPYELPAPSISNTIDPGSRPARKFQTDADSNFEANQERIMDKILDEISSEPMDIPDPAAPPRIITKPARKHHKTFSPNTLRARFRQHKPTDTEQPRQRSISPPAPALTKVEGKAQNVPPPREGVIKALRDKVRWLDERNVKLSKKLAAVEEEKARLQDMVFGLLKTIRIAAGGAVEPDEREDSEERD